MIYGRPPRNTIRRVLREGVFRIKVVRLPLPENKTLGMLPEGLGWAVLDELALFRRTLVVEPTIRPT